MFQNFFSITVSFSKEKKNSHISCGPIEKGHKFFINYYQLEPRGAEKTLVGDAPANLNGWPNHSPPNTAAPTSTWTVFLIELMKLKAL